MSQPGCSSSSRRTTAGRIRLDTLWKVPMSIRPLPALKRSTALASASASREQIAAVGQDHLAKGVIRTGLGPPGRSKTAPPRARSSAAICWLTDDWV